jgi:serine/threonine protein phosphatase PrpC
MKFELKEHTHKGLIREVNEDNLGHGLNSVNGDIFVVCDGMGGHAGGQQASKIGVNAILAELSQKQHSNMHVAISAALVFANDQVLGHAASVPSLKGMGSTATVAVIKDDLLYIGNVGDSRAYIFSDGKLFRITRDDSYVQELVDSNAITEDEAETHPNKNRILQALGSKAIINPRIPGKPFKLKSGDVLMLCSDGLTSMVIDEFIEQLINPNDLLESIDKMHDLAMTNGGKDNITITLIKIVESPFSTSEFDHYTQKYLKIETNKIAQPELGITMVPNPPKKKNKPLIFISSIAAVLLVGFGLYFFTNLFKGKNDVKSGGTQENKTNNNDSIITKTNDDKIRIFKEEDNAPNGGTNKEVKDNNKNDKSKTDNKKSDDNDKGKVPVDEVLKQLEQDVENQQKLVKDKKECNAVPGEEKDAIQCRNELKELKDRLKKLEQKVTNYKKQKAAESKGS